MYHRVGVFNGEGPPVPIPNTAVKLTCADDTCLATGRENRSTPTQDPRSSDRGSFISSTNPDGFADEQDALRFVPRLPAGGGQLDTHSARSVFSAVHAAGENDQNSFAPAGANSARHFVYNLIPAIFGSRVSFYPLLVFFRRLWYTPFRKHICFCEEDTPWPQKAPRNIIW